MAIPMVPFLSLLNRVETNFKFNQIGLSALKSAMKKMNNKKDYNSMSVEFLLSTFNVTGPIVLNLINKSFETGIFPHRWKESIVVPIEKVKKAKTLEEYRPINMLLIESKVIETSEKAIVGHARLSYTLHCSYLDGTPRPHF